MGHSSCVELLAKLGANVNAKAIIDSGNSYNSYFPRESSSDWIAPIHLAAEYGQAHCIKILIFHKANIDIRNRWGLFLLLLIVYYGCSTNDKNVVVYDYS